MNKTWHEFLSTQGATITNGVVQAFAEENSVNIDLHQTHLCDLSNFGLIQASGEDAKTFLHGQFTNDLNAITASTSQLSSYCNPKGRLYSIFRIYKHEDSYRLLIPKDVIETTLKKLLMFKLMAKVELQDVSDQFVVFGLAGADALKILKSKNIQAPNEANHLTYHNATTIICVPSDSERMMFVCSPDDAIDLWKSFTSDAKQATSKIWELHDIQSGIPQITSQTSEAFIPQMVNLELIGGVNFQKGCYPGQEIVARTHYLGKPNRRMYKINIHNENCPRPGTNIFSVKDGEQPVGKIVSAQKMNRDLCEALAVLRTEKENDNELKIESLSGPNATIHSLPYSLNSN